MGLTHDNTSSEVNDPITLAKKSALELEAKVRNSLDSPVRNDPDSQSPKTTMVFSGSTGQIFGDLQSIIVH